MSKKQSKISKVKKVVKPAKKLAPKKAKPGKAAKNIKIKKTAKPVKKAVKKIVSKKTTNKKVAKPVKKAVAKKITPKKVVKPAKKVIKKIAPKKTVKPVKKVAIKKVVPKKASKSIDNKTKKAAAKPAKTVIAKKVVEPVKKIAPVKAAKEEKILKNVEKKKVEKAEIIKPVKEKLKPRGKGGRKPKSKGDDDEPEIVHDELIEQIIQTTRRQSKQPKQPKILKTFVNPMTSLAVAVDSIKKGNGVPKKEPKGKFELEYVVRTSAGILYELLTTPSGLSEWFADDVNIRDGIFTFFWDGSEQKARLLGFKEDKYVRLQWMDKPEGYYFEFRIDRDELTSDISLIIIDFADEASDMQTSKLLWDSQVNKLLNVLGSN